MICAYAVRAADGPGLPPRGRGLAGARLRTVRRDGLAAVYTAHRTFRPTPTPAQVRVHERVVEATGAQGPALPFRFGTVLADADRLAAVLTDRREELLAALARVRGRVELAVRALPTAAAAAPRPAAPVPAPSADTLGRDYLRARVARQRQIDRAAATLHAPLAALAAATVVRERPAPPAVFVGAYLVDRERVAAFEARAAAAADGLPTLAVVVSGPFQPYNFVGP